jgi:hypothetical protein
VKENGGTFTFPSTTPGQYRRLAFSVDGLGNLNAIWSSAVASIPSLTDPGLLHAQMAGVPVGYLDLEAVGGASAAEITDITCLADSGFSLSNKYWTFTVLEVSVPKTYYVWYRSADGGAPAAVDPAIPGATGIEVFYSQNDSAIAVAQNTLTYIGINSNIVSLGYATVVRTVDTIRITNLYTGSVTDATAGTSGFTVSVVTQGATSTAAFKTAGSATTVIENKVGSDIRIFRYGSGSGSGGGGAGASLLDPNYDETFIYYTRSDFAVDKKTFFGSTTGTDSILGLGKVVLDGKETFISANILGPVFLSDNPVINTAQVRLLYKTGKVDSNNGNAYLFTIAEASASNGAVYSHNGVNYTVVGSIFSHTELFVTGSGTPSASGTLTLVSGSGDATITFTAWKPGIGVSYNGGTSWVAPYQSRVSGNFVIADFNLPAGTTATDFRICVVSGTNASELAGFGVNLVQDNVGAYGGDASYEMRTITSTEASTGLITLTGLKFTPGAHQLHCNYNGHDFMAPDFIELGGGQVQFPLSFFTAGDVAKFYVGYGLINQTDAPTTINNMLSSNSTLGSVQIPSGFTLDKPYMEIPSGATVSGAGNVETTGVITGDGILATTGNVLSTGYEPTQPKYDRIEEATATKGVAIKGRSDGGSPGPGDVGESALAKISAGGITILAANTDTDVPGLALTLTKGVWLVGYNVCAATYNNTGSAINIHGRLKITDASNSLFSGSECLVGKDGLATASSIYFSASRSLPIVLSSDTVLKVRAAKSHADTTNARLYIYDSDMFGALTNPDNNSIFWAIRIA